MAIDYSVMSALAQTLIAANGRAVTFVKQDRTPADAAVPWRGAAAPTATPGATELAGSAVFVPPSSVASLGMSTKASDLVKRSEAIMMVGLGPTATADLSDYDEVVDGASRWRIVGVEKLAPGSTTLLYYVGVEGK